MCSALVYFVPDRHQIYVVPNFQGFTTGSLIESRVDAMDLRGALEMALELSSKATEGANNPIMKALGVRSYKAVVRETHLAAVLLSGGGYKLLNFRRDVRSGAFVGDKYDKAEVVDALDGVVECVLAFFDGCK